MNSSYSSIFNAHHGNVTDKWSSYLAFYDAHLTRYTSRAEHILEIGVQNGGSLEVLAKLFPKAALILGIDIDPKCGELVFDDTRIRVIIGDATSPEVLLQVKDLSDLFDVIIDDGSHTSKDIVATVFRYFPLVKPGGLLVLEDLHCNYWSSHGGQLFSPSSAQSFLHRLADVVNIEHFQKPETKSLLLAYAARGAGVDSIDEALLEIEAIEFRNSMCAIYRSAEGKPGLGVRRVVGKRASVIDVVLGFDGQRCQPPGDALVEPFRSPERLVEDERVVVLERDDLKRNLFVQNEFQGIAMEFFRVVGERELRNLVTVTEVLDTVKEQNRLVSEKIAPTEQALQAALIQVEALSSEQRFFAISLAETRQLLEVAEQHRSDLGNSNAQQHQKVLELSGLLSAETARKEMEANERKRLTRALEELVEQDRSSQNLIGGLESRLSAAHNELDVQSQKVAQLESGLKQYKEQLSTTTVSLTATEAKIGRLRLSLIYRIVRKLGLLPTL
jgi:Methyltransferase domain